MSPILQGLLGVVAYLTLDSLHDSSVVAKYASTGEKRKLYDFIVHSVDSIIKTFAIYFIMHSFTQSFYTAVKLTGVGLALNYTLFAFEFNAWGIVFGLLNRQWKSLLHRGQNVLDRVFGKYNWLFRAGILVVSVFIALFSSNAFIDRIINGWTPLVIAILTGFYLFWRFYIRRKNS